MNHRLKSLIQSRQSSKGSNGNGHIESSYATPHHGSHMPNKGPNDDGSTGYSHQQAPPPSMNSQSSASSQSPTNANSQLNVTPNQYNYCNPPPPAPGTQPVVVDRPTPMSVDQPSELEPLKSVAGGNGSFADSMVTGYLDPTSPSIDSSIASASFGGLLMDLNSYYETKPDPISFGSESQSLTPLPTVPISTVLPPVSTFLLPSFRGEQCE